MEFVLREDMSLLVQGNKSFLESHNLKLDDRSESFGEPLSFVGFGSQDILRWPSLYMNS